MSTPTSHPLARNTPSDPLSRSFEGDADSEEEMGLDEWAARTAMKKEQQQRQQERGSILKETKTTPTTPTTITTSTQHPIAVRHTEGQRVMDAHTRLELAS